MTIYALALALLAAPGVEITVSELEAVVTTAYFEETVSCSVCYFQDIRDRLAIPGCSEVAPTPDGCRFAITYDGPDAAEIARRAALVQVYRRGWARPESHHLHARHDGRLDVTVVTGIFADGFETGDTSRWGS